MNLDQLVKELAKLQLKQPWNESFEVIICTDKQSQFTILEKDSRVVNNVEVIDNKILISD